MAIVEDTGGFSGIIVAAHELGHLYVPPKNFSIISIYSLSPPFLSGQTWGCARRVSPSVLPRGSRGGEVQLGGRIHHERPEAHQQGLQVVPLHSQAVSALSQVSQCLLRCQLRSLTWIYLAAGKQPPACTTHPTKKSLFPGSSTLNFHQNCPCTDRFDIITL